MFNIQYPSGEENSLRSSVDSVRGLGFLSQRARRFTEREESEDSLLGVLGERDWGLHV